MHRIVYCATVLDSAKNAPAHNVLQQKELPLDPKDLQSIQAKLEISHVYAVCFHSDAQAQVLLRYHGCPGKAATMRSSHQYRENYQVHLEAAPTLRGWAYTLQVTRLQRLQTYSGVAWLQYACCATLLYCKGCRQSFPNYTSPQAVLWRSSVHFYLSDPED